MAQGNLTSKKAPAAPQPPDGMSRRNILAGGAVVGLAALAGAGLAGYKWGRDEDRLTVESAGKAATPAPTVTTTGNVHSFLSRPDLQPPVLSVDVVSAPAGVPPYVFLANKPYAAQTLVGQRGLLIAERGGDIAWFNPIEQDQVLDFNVQTYKGKPVLTWWHGETGATYGQGNCYIADSTYTQIAEVKCGNGLMADMHEFNLTSQGTALVDAYNEQKADLTSVGGKHGVVAAGVVQEIDIATGDVIFEWNSLDHVPLTESMVPIGQTGTPGSPYDYFHINSIGVAWDGDLLVSGRNTSTIYKIGRRDGQVKWRLGGKSSSFTVGPGASFYYQHHVRSVGTGVITIFDNGASPQMQPQSRGMIVKLDLTNMTATLQQAFTSPARLLADNQGSMQLLPGGRAFVGWGAQPYYTEFDADGSVTMNGQLPNGDQSYRAFTAGWVGYPTDKPAVALQANPAQGTAVYVSWNGGTEVATWQVLAGKHPSGLGAVATQPRNGFETMIVADSRGPYFAVAAYDASGKQLGASKVAKLG
ncbi:arylsulfotransferase family protein [Trebonia sp.]|uniref:arylsulfotransferase family protein n=1 Tax=Trebonia sp. TaxID=2767075 RepID=UPI002636B01B|nr:arylsulfotransferase family protein [Trebonia sp.]